LYYLPIYFQSVDNASAVESGVRNLAMIIAVPIASIAVGIGMTKTGIAAPFMFIGGLLGTVASGLFYTLDIGTPSGNWIGYQIIAGVAFGGAFQVSLVTAQAATKPEDMSSITAFFFRESSILLLITGK
jgi:MFS transporter, DHA2 family, glioxin efflux transporter